MREGLLEFVVCTRCAAPLTLHAKAHDGDHVVDGTLTCAACGASYPIVRGVPDLRGATGVADVEQTTEGFARNWERYAATILASPALNEELFRDWIAPMLPERLEGKVVLDAGCGMGRWVHTAAAHRPRAVVGFDYSPVAHVAYENTKHMPHVHILRADLFHPPFPQVFDVAYSIGVLHHTPDPEGGFAALLPTVKADGVLAAWVYGQENNGWIEHVVSPLRRHVTSRMPDRVLLALSRGLAWELAAATKVYQAAFPTQKVFFYDAYLRHIAKYPLSYLEHIVYDHLVPSIAQYLPRNEVESWATKRGLSYALTARNENSWRLVTARSPGALSSFTH